MLGEGGPVDKTKDMKMCAYKKKEDNYLVTLKKVPILWKMFISSYGLNTLNKSFLVCHLSNSIQKR